jgi:hypothetical protein
MEFKSKSEERRVKARFMYFVKQEGDCWLWTGKTDASGNPMFCGESVRKVLYEFEGNVVPGGQFAVPVCRKRDCVHPDHVRLVSAAQAIGWYDFTV